MRRRDATTTSISLAAGFLDRRQVHDCIRCAPRDRYMLNRLSAVCFGCALALLTGIAGGAQVPWYGTNYQIHSSTPVPVGSNDLYAVTLTAVGLNGRLPNGFDGGPASVPNPLSGITTSGNSLHQYWEFDVVKTPDLDLALGGNSVFQPIDTHFLVTDLNTLTTGPRDENRPLEDDTEAVNAGYGSFLVGSFTKTGPAAATWDFAYLVAPWGTHINLEFRVSAAGYPNELVTGGFNVPEPSSACLLAIGAVGLALGVWARRRRAA
jgi:hypothetical protein